ncbi:MAG TPA: hypothetical protein VHS06_04590, partial [Chloroflexota bacterium]|nr:hypothetical protein [Chloroflexota bacterium]
GAAAITTEKVQNLVNDWVRRGDLSAEEGKTIVREYSSRGGRGATDFVKDMGARGQQQASDLGREARSRMRDLASDLGLATRDEVQRLAARVQALEDQLSKPVASSGAESGEPEHAEYNIPESPAEGD